MKPPIYNTMLYTDMPAWGRPLNMIYESKVWERGEPTEEYLA